MHFHCLHWLTWTGLLSLNAFCRPCKSTTGEMAPRRAPGWLWGPDMAPTLSARLSRPCSGILALCGCMYISYSYSKLYYLCLLSSLIKLLPPPTPPPSASRPPPNIHWPNINEFHQKIIKTGENQPLSTCQVSCTIANR